MATITERIKLQDEMSGGLNKINSGLNSVKTEFDTTSSKAVAFGVILAQIGIQALRFGANLISSALSYNNQMEQYTTNFKVMLGSTEAAVAKVQELKEFAAKTPFAMSDLASATQTLLGFGISNEKVMPYMQSLGDVALGNSQRFQSLSLAFAQTMASGKLMGQDLNQMINQGFNPLEEISRKTGISIGELKEKMSKGEISAQMVADAFKTATEEGGRFYKGMEEASKTMDGLSSTLKDNVASMWGKLFTPLSKAIKAVMPAVINFVAFLTENLDVVAVVLAGITAIILTAVIPALWGMVAPLMAQAIAWAIINWPILLIIGLVTALLAIFLKYPEVFGMVSGAFMVGVALIWNTLLGLGELMLSLIAFMVNPWVDFANFIGNVFENPVSSIIKLFEGMADNVLALLEGIAKAIDAIFGSNLASTVSGWRAGLKELANKAIEKYAPDENYKEKFAKFETTMADLGFERMEYGAAWEGGKDWGTDFAQSVSDFLKGIEIPVPEQQQPPVDFDFSGINDKLDDTNKLLNGKGSLKSAGDVKIKEDNLKYLLDIATLKYQNQYGQTAPVVNVNVSTGDINNGTDEKRLFQKFENIIVKALDNNLVATT